jgi:hypothetical protein
VGEEVFCHFCRPISERYFHCLLKNYSKTSTKPFLESILSVFLGSIPTHPTLQLNHSWKVSVSVGAFQHIELISGASYGKYLEVFVEEVF